MKVKHTLKPIYDENSKVLILGSLPSVKSREIGFYYGHPKNRFWSTLEKVFEEKIAKAEEEIRQLQNRKRKLLNQKKDAERKARTHRLIERGAILESLLEKPEQYSNEQIKGLMEIVLQTPQAQEHLRKIGEENGEN